MKTLALRARVFIHCFLVFGYPGETLALVVHILHQNCRKSSSHSETQVKILQIRKIKGKLIFLYFTGGAFFNAGKTSIWA